MRNFTKIFALFAGLILCLSVCACGKMSNPRPIEDSGYPHSYPIK